MPISDAQSQDFLHLVQEPLGIAGLVTTALELLE